jgi:hypothetical protein
MFVHAVFSNLVYHFARLISLPLRASFSYLAQEADLAYVRAVMSWDIPQITRAGIFPSVEQIEMFSKLLKTAAEASQKRIEDLKGDGEAEDDDIDVEVDVGNVPLAGAPEASAAVLVTSEGEGQATGTNNLTEEKTEQRNGQKEKKSNNNNSSNNNKNNKNKKNKKDSKAEEEERRISSQALVDNTRLSTLLSRFVELSQMDGRYFLCDHEAIVLVSNWLHSIPLSLSDRYVSLLFCL